MRPAGEWLAAKAVSLAPAESRKFIITPGEGLLVNGLNGHTIDLITESEFGDVQAHVEFCIPKGSKSVISQFATDGREPAANGFHPDGSRGNMVQMKTLKLNDAQVSQLKGRMDRLAGRNPDWEINRRKFPSETDYYRRLFFYFVAQKLTWLYEDELFDKLVVTDRSATGKGEELLDAYMVLDHGNEIHLNLFQLKFTEKFDGGISTKELFAFVQRMNTVFLHGDLADRSVLEAYENARAAFAAVCESNHKAVPRIHCYYVVNGQGVSSTDAAKVEEIRETFKADRHNYGFTFEAYGGLDLYHLVELGRVPIQDEILEVAADQKPAALLHHYIGENRKAMPTRVLIGFVNVNQLIRLVDRYSNNELFEKNVRLFLGLDKEVNRGIIDTITSDRNNWFAFMNNGVSITADKVTEMRPIQSGTVRVKLENMQIINGCQTVNSLYRAKFDGATRDRFQGNSSVMVRIYEIEQRNTEFMEALIRATNSQNAIRAEDLMANDPVQIRLQTLLREYRIGYERKEGEALPCNGYTIVFTKEDAALAYLASFRGHSARLWGSLGRAKLFRREEEYRGIFPTEILEDDQVAQQRALELAAAYVVLSECRTLALKPSGSHKKVILRKARYYLARAVFKMAERQIRSSVESLAKKPPSAKEAGVLIKLVRSQVQAQFTKATQVLEDAFAEFQKTRSGDLDTALKNEAFAQLVATALDRAASAA